MERIESAKNICKHYSAATKMKCDFILIDNIDDEQCIYGCDLCKKLSEMGITKKKCIDVYKYSYYQAERFGGEYIFFCSIGLMHWCTVVDLGEQGKGLFVSGPVTLVDQNEFLEDEVFSKIGEIEPNLAIELYKLAQEIPRCEPDTVTSLSKVLFNLAQYELSPRKKDIEPDKEFVDNVNLLKNVDELEYSYSIEKEKELLSAIKQLDEEKARRVMNEILASIFVIEGVDLKVLRSRVFELVVLLSRTVMEVGVEIDEVFGINCYLLDDIYEINDLDELLHWSNNILKKFMDLVFGLRDIKNKDIIFKAIAYINKNYMNRISLEEVSEHIALSPAYFSSIFKKEMDINFSDYLNKIRIENSKKLLLDSSIKLVDIAYLVGFSSQSYFTKVFKELEGITPGQYRQSNII